MRSAFFGFFLRTCCGFVLLFASVTNAQTVTVNVADLGAAIASSQSEPDAVQRLLLEEIQRRIDDLDLQLTDNELLFSDELTDEVIEDGCTSTTIQRMTTNVAIAGDTGISISLQSLFDPVELSLRLSATIDTAGRARQILGFRFFGSCVDLGRDTFDFTANGPLDLELDLSLNLNPQFVNDSTLRIDPVISIEGELLQSDISVDVDDSLLRGVLESFLQDEVDDLFSSQSLSEEIAEFQISLNEQFATDDVIEFELPPSTDEQILALYELLTPQARFPLSADFLEANRLEFLAALIFDDQERITEILEDAAFCEITESLQVDLPQAPVYQLRNGACELAGVDQTAVLFSDSNCLVAFDFFPTTFSDFCRVALDSNQLGNAQSNSFELQRWSLSPGSRFEVGVEPIEGKQQPFVQRVNYKNVATATGNCGLEMRVYKDNPSSINQRAVIALHGGSWQNRGTGFLGVENMATHFVDEGFVVFAPFYRLVSDSDGSEQCHNATFEELLSDIDDAFEWVQQNAASYGASGKPVVFGQSAGGQLASYLALQQPEQIDRAVLFYAPSDFIDFIGQIQNGEYTNGTGIRIMERVTGETLETLDLQSPLVVSNSFPAIVAADPERYPPMFLLHGESDTLLPSRQSVRMCNALAGDVENGPAPFDLNTQSARRIFACDDRGSQLHLIAEGEHTLDLCISDELCFAGSPVSAAATADSVQRMLDWVVTDSVVEVAALSNRAATGGGQFGLPGLLLLLLSYVFSRRLQVRPRR